MITVDDVKARLLHIGYTASEADEGMIGYIISKVEGDLKAFCGIAEISEDIDHKWVDIVCGEFLQIKKDSGQDIGIDVDSAVSSISEGDTSISFLNGKGQMSKEQRLEKLISILVDRDDLTAFRRMSW